KTHSLRSSITTNQSTVWIHAADTPIQLTTWTPADSCSASQPVSQPTKRKLANGNGSNVSLWLCQTSL
ncbi:unnamed protein product, partial [Ceratitis capitata]